MLSEEAKSPYTLLLRAVLMIPVSHYVIGLLLILTVFLYNFLEIHILRDLLNGFRGDPVILTFNPSSHVYRDVVSKCRVLHGRYLPTPWLCSPNIQTLFLHFFGNAPRVNFRRQIFMTSDGGTLALDWAKGHIHEDELPFRPNDAEQHGIKNPIVIIVPGLTSDSKSSYIKHLVSSITKHGWDVVVSNHRGLGGVSVTSDSLYNAGWTEDVRAVIDQIHGKHPEAPLFVVGTSIGANILVKYLAEDGVSTPIVGAASICSPWDLLVCDRFINRKLLQRLYNLALAIGLKDYAEMHEAVLSRLSNWEGVKKARSVRDYDDSATIILGNYETVDTYYRRCSSSIFVGGVMVPLLCISSFDDPICTSEAIPWDECRLNKNVVLATTKHGGHLPFFEGFAAKRVWWVRAVDEFFCALNSSHFRHRKKQAATSAVSSLNSPIDHAPYVHMMEDGTVTAIGDEMPEEVAHQEEDNKGKSGISSLDSSIDHSPYVQILEDGTVTTATDEPDETEIMQQGTDHKGKSQEESIILRGDGVHEEKLKAKQISQLQHRRGIGELIVPTLNQLSRRHQFSLWLLAYIAVITTWPVLGSTLSIFLKRRIRALFSKPKM